MMVVTPVPVFRGVLMTPDPAPAALDGDQVDPVVASFAVAGQIRVMSAGTTARLQLALSEDVKTTSSELVPALLTLGQRVLEERRLLGRELPEVDVTGIERVREVPSSARTTGFTVAVTNDFSTRRSRIAVDSDLLMVDDGGALLVAATLIGAAEHLLAAGDGPVRQVPRRRQPSPRRPRGRARD